MSLSLFSFFNVSLLTFIDHDLVAKLGTSTPAVPRMKLKSLQSGEASTNTNKDISRGEIALDFALPVGNPGIIFSDLQVDYT